MTMPFHMQSQYLASSTKSISEIAEADLYFSVCNKKFDKKRVFIVQFIKRLCSALNLFKKFLHFLNVTRERFLTTQPVCSNRDKLLNSKSVLFLSFAAGTKWPL